MRLRVRILILTDVAATSTSTWCAQPSDDAHVVTLPGFTKPQAMKVTIGEQTGQRFNPRPYLA